MARQIDIDEEEYARLRKIDQTLAVIMANPKAAVLAEQAAKISFPNARTPNLDAATAAEQAQGGIRKEFEEFKAAQEKRDSERERADKLDRLNAEIEAGVTRLKQAGWTEEGIAGVRKLMDEKGILDVEIAAAAFEKKHPPQTPITPGGQGGGAWNFMEPPSDSDADLKRLIETKGQSDQLTDKMARVAIEDVRGQARR